MHIKNRIYGIGELLIENIMHRVKEKLQLSIIPKLAQFFDYIVGSGTSGYVPLNSKHFQLQLTVQSNCNSARTIAAASRKGNHSLL